MARVLLNQANQFAIYLCRVQINKHVLCADDSISHAELVNVKLAIPTSCWWKRTVSMVTPREGPAMRLRQQREHNNLRHDHPLSLLPPTWLTRKLEQPTCRTTPHGTNICTSHSLLSNINQYMCVPVCRLHICVSSPLEFCLPMRPVNHVWEPSNVENIAELLVGKQIGTGNCVVKTNSPCFPHIFTDVYQRYENMAFWFSNIYSGTWLNPYPENRYEQYKTWLFDWIPPKDI